MKPQFLSALLAIIPFATNAQVDSTEPISVDGLSYAQYNHQHHPDLKYAFDVTKQTHSYSGNWDFDGDGIKVKQGDRDANVDNGEWSF